MLKFEKASSDRQINVILRDKEVFATRTFLLAFALALAFHLVFVILFQITPFKLSFSNTVIPPVHVEANLFLRDAAVSTDIDRLPQLSSGLPSREPSAPIIPEHPNFLYVKHLGYITEKNTTENPFTQIERQIFQPDLTPLSKSPLPPISIVVSGTLANLEVIESGLDGNSIPNYEQKRGNEMKNIYAVLVEGRSGRIFWYEPKQVTSMTAVDRFAEGVLHHIRFINSQDVVVAGEIEISFNSLEQL